MRASSIALTFLLTATLAAACGDDTSSDSSSAVSSSASGGSGSGGSGTGACASACANTGCNDHTPDDGCMMCANASCSAEIDACMADMTGMCGATVDCGRCGALMQCDECSSQLDLDNDGSALFNALLSCLCG